MCVCVCFHGDSPNFALDRDVEGRGNGEWGGKKRGRKESKETREVTLRTKAGGPGVCCHLS